MKSATFNQFKTAMKKACRMNKCLFYDKDGVRWIGTGEVFVDCTLLKDSEWATLRQEVEQVSRSMRELEETQSFINRWTAGEMKSLTRTKVRWGDIIVLTSEYGTIGVQQQFMDVIDRLLETDEFTLNWTGLAGSRVIRVTLRERLVGFLAPCLLVPDALRSTLEEILEGLAPLMRVSSQ